MYSLQAFHSIARCVAALALANDVASVVNEFMTSLSKKETSDSVQVFCLLTLGEIGRHQDMSAHAQPEGDYRSVLLLLMFSCSLFTQLE